MDSGIGERSNVDSALQRPQKLFRSKPVERIFFSPYFLPSQNRAARFSPSADVITFFGLIHLKQAKIRLSQRSK
jgi:hypothetical protein